MTALIDRPRRCPRDHTCASRRGHDNARGYDAGCRSRLALDDIIRAQRERTNRLVPIVGVARKLQALGRLGFSSRHLGRHHLHCDGVHVCQLRIPAYDSCWSETAVRVDVVYLELSETEPPVGRGATRARNDARRRGWEPVEAWDGVDIDDPEAQAWTGHTGLAALGDPLALAALEARTTTWAQLTRADHDLVVDELHGRGRSHNDIAVHLDLHPDVVRSAWERVTRRHQRAMRRQQQTDQAGAA